MWYSAYEWVEILRKTGVKNSTRILKAEERKQITGGCKMIGAILGDIVGSIYEFDNIKTKEFELFDKECFFTDDTVMTIAIAEA